jgi:hypothetical protein
MMQISDLEDAGLTPEWIAEHERFDCRGDDPPPLLAACGDFRRSGSVAMSGEIRDGRGYHPMATFSPGPHARGHDHPVRADDPFAVLRSAARILRTMGWALLDVSANETTGYVRIIAETRDWDRREGRMITLIRSSHTGHVREVRERTVLKPGCFESYWEPDWHLGSRRFDNLADAARELLGYACDNGPHGGLTEGESATRREALSGSLKLLPAPARKEPAMRRTART